MITRDAAFYRDVIGIEAVSSKDVREALAEVEGDVVVWINSPGGSVYEAGDIYTMLEKRAASGAKVTTIASGVAASAAAMVFLAGTDRLIGGMTELMFHEASQGIVMFGKADEIAAEAEKTVGSLRKTNGQLVDRIVDRTGKSTDEAARLLRVESWYVQKDAIAEGFATGKAFPRETENATEQEPEDDSDVAADRASMLDLLNSVGVYHS